MSQLNWTELGETFASSSLSLTEIAEEGNEERQRIRRHVSGWILGNRFDLKDVFSSSVSEHFSQSRRLWTPQIDANLFSEWNRSVRHHLRSSDLSVRRATHKCVSSPFLEWVSHHSLSISTKELSLVQSCSSLLNVCLCSLCIGWFSFIESSQERIRTKKTAEDSKHSKEQFGFDLKIIGYRRSQVNCIEGEYDVLVFVETTDSFEFLFDDAHWPSQSVGKNFTLKKPSIPPQLSAVIQNVALDIDWKEFTEDLQSNYPDIVKVVRLKNRNLQDLKLVKIEIKSVKTRNEIIEQKLIGIASIRYKNCRILSVGKCPYMLSMYGYWSFSKRTVPQQDHVTCKNLWREVFWYQGPWMLRRNQNAFIVVKLIDLMTQNVVSLRTIVQPLLERCSTNQGFSKWTMSGIQIFHPFHHDNRFKRILWVKTRSIWIKFSRKWKRKVRRLARPLSRSRPKCSNGTPQIKST